MSQDTSPAVTKARRSMAKGIAQNQGHFAHCPFFEIVPSRAVNVPQRLIRNKNKKVPPDPADADKPSNLNPPDRKIEHTGGNGARVYNISGSVPGTLSFDDASVFMVVLSLTAPDHRRLTFEHGDITRRTLLDDISPSGTETLGTNTNYHELLNKLGWTINTRSYERLECSIKRLSFVRFIYTFRGQSWTSSLIGFRRENKNKNKIMIIINAVSASVILGNRKSGCVLADTQELREISSQSEKAIYFAIIRLIKPGENSSLSVNSILEYIYRGRVTDDQRKKFFHTVTSLQNKIPEWSLKLIGKGNDKSILIARPPLRST